MAEMIGKERRIFDPNELAVTHRERQKEVHEEFTKQMIENLGKRNDELTLETIRKEQKQKRDAGQLSSEDDSEKEIADEHERQLKELLARAGMDGEF